MRKVAESATPVDSPSARMGLTQMGQKITSIKKAQKIVKDFTIRNGWEDFPNVDKFDHLHEELVEMSQHIRYKTRKEAEEFVKKNGRIFEDGIGDLTFALCRLANQLGVDMEKAFNLSQKEILGKYGRGKETNVLPAKNSPYRVGNKGKSRRS